MQIEPQELRLAYSVYGVWALLGIAGAIVSFWKHGTISLLGFFSYSALFATAILFLVTTVRSQIAPTSRALSRRGLVLLAIAYVPIFAHMLRS